MHDDIEEVLITEQALQARIAELAGAIARDYDGRPLLLICILKGAIMFLVDLARAIPLPVQMDFMAISSYGNATESSGVVRILKDLDQPIEGKDVLIVEDIVDSGLTLASLRKNLRARNPASLEVCALLVKEGLQRVDPDLKYVGFRIPDRFVVGYGLDYDQRYRALPYVATLVLPPGELAQ